MKTETNKSFHFRNSNLFQTAPYWVVTIEAATHEEALRLACQHPELTFVDAYGCRWLSCNVEEVLEIKAVNRRGA